MWVGESLWQGPRTSRASIRVIMLGKPMPVEHSCNGCWNCAYTGLGDPHFLLGSELRVCLYQHAMRSYIKMYIVANGQWALSQIVKELIAMARGFLAGAAAATCFVVKKPIPVGSQGSMPQGPITSSALDDPSGCQDARVVKGIACLLPHHFNTQMTSILASV